jgi:hypothetical protein
MFLTGRLFLLFYGEHWNFVDLSSSTCELNSHWPECSTYKMEANILVMGNQRAKFENGSLLGCRNSSQQSTVSNRGPSIILSQK